LELTMPIARPAPHSTIDTVTWGIPITDAINPVAHVEITAHVAVSATTAAAGQKFLDAGPFTYDGGPILVEFYSSNVQCAANSQILVNLWDGNTDLGYFAQVIAGGAMLFGVPVLARRRLVPSAGAHTFNLRAWVTSAAGQISAGAGTAPGQNAPAYLRITRTPSP
jgi:hypothetical protein